MSARVDRKKNILGESPILLLVLIAEIEFSFFFVLELKTEKKNPSLVVSAA